ncbi:MAG: YdcF family protein [Pseudodesulfovibrio sp.]
MVKFIRFTLQALGALTLLTLVVSFGMLLFAGHWMDVNDEPIKTDFILPLAGNDNRLISAAELYKKGYAPVILISNAVTHPHTRLERLEWKMGYPKHSRTQYQTLILQTLGADSAKLESFGNGHISTVEEAEALRKHLNSKKASLLIVTSPYHARRAKMIFEKILPDCRIAVTTTEEGAFERSWWKDQTSAQNLIMEFAKTMHYLLGGAFRSTDGTEIN